MLKALALKLGVSGPAAAGCWHPGDVSPGTYTQSKLFWGALLPQFSRTPDDLHCIPQTSLGSTRLLYEDAGRHSCGN